jgi:hypothetical protein
LRLFALVIGEVILMLQAFLFLRGCVIIHVVLICSKDAGWLHSTSSLGAKYAFDHNTSAHVKRPTIVADPVVIRNLVYAVAPLVNRDIAGTTEDDKVLVLVVSVVANGTLGVFLHYESSLMRTKRVVSLNIEAVGAIAIRVVSPLR